MHWNAKELEEIIKWSVEAAVEHVDLANFRNEFPDPEPGMGLWQSFQKSFPKENSVDYDLAVLVHGATYREVVKALLPPSDSE